MAAAVSLELFFFFPPNCLQGERVRVKENKGVREGSLF